MDRDGHSFVSDLWIGTELSHIRVFSLSNAD